AFMARREHRRVVMGPRCWSPPPDRQHRGPASFNCNREIEMERIAQYTVVTARDHADLAEKVNALIAQSWQPQGGVNIGLLCGQAMVMYARDAQAGPR